MWCEQAVEPLGGDWTAHGPVRWFSPISKSGGNWISSYSDKAQMVFFLIPPKVLSSNWTCCSCGLWKTLWNSTHKLEGDGALALSCLEVIEELEPSIHVMYAPNLDAIARRLSATIPHHRKHMVHSVSVYSQDWTTSRWRSAQVWEKLCLSLKLRDCLFHIEFTWWGQLLAPLIHCVFTFLSSQDISGLKEELPLYIARAI